jgi:hypothetical protein
MTDAPQTGTKYICNQAQGQPESGGLLECGLNNSILATRLNEERRFTAGNASREGADRA